MVTKTLYAKYPSNVPLAFQARASDEIRGSEYLSNNFFKEYVEISDDLYSILSDSFREREFHLKSEVEEIFNEYSQRAREKAAAMMK